MRALVLIGTACLALSACGDRVPDNTIQFDNGDSVETVPDDNWVDLNAQQTEANVAQPCADDRRCVRDPDGPTA